MNVLQQEIGSVKVYLYLYTVGVGLAEFVLLLLKHLLCWWRRLGV